MKFWEFYRIICKRKTLIAALVIATIAIIFVVTAQRQYQYEAVSQIMPSDVVLHRPIISSVLTGGIDGSASRKDREGQLANLMSLITSRTVAERTVGTLKLDMSPETLQRKISVDTAMNPAAHGGAANTDIIEIRVKDGDPNNAVQIANAVAMVFASYYQEISHQNAETNVRALEEEVAKAERDLDLAESALKSYKKEKGMAALPEGTNVVLANITETQHQRDQAAAQLAEAQQRLASINQQLARESPTKVVEEGTTDSPLVQQLEAQVASLKIKLSEAQAKYYDVHPTVQDLKQSLADAQAKLESEKKKFRMRQNIVANPIRQSLLAQKSQLESDVKGFSARVSQLDAALERAKGSLAPGEDVKLQRLQQEFLDSQARCSAVKERLNQARLDEKDTSATGAIRLVDKAVAARGPIGKSRSSYLVMGLILSLIVGVGLVLMLETLDNRIRSNVDVEQLLSLPVNALIPSMTGRNAPALPKITYLDPLSPLAEAYRFLRTDLLLTAAESGCQTIMVATAKPGQGGTTTIANLAISLAMDGKRVVIVDGDMRRPTLHRIFKANNDYGLSSVLSGEKDLDEVLVSTEVQNLMLLPAGPTPTNPSEMLGSQRMGDVVETLRQGADFVLFDTPSAIAFTDTIVLSRWIDGVLLVVRANQVPRGAELQVRKLFNKANVRILGVVLNDVQPTNVDSYYYHSHYYPNAGSTILALEGNKGGVTEPDEED